MRDAELAVYVLKLVYIEELLIEAVISTLKRIPFLELAVCTEGLIEDEAVVRLKEIGKWLDKNGEAIYSTVATPIYTKTQSAQAGVIKINIRVMQKS